uniref:Nucleic acid binding protein n=1 Tax=Dioscorea bacilliform BL virus TaxID=3065014 RepID=A0AA49K4F0_9VIRU|nr:putative nucleic acid binding protein [Dioscorea bacilliform BL virus]
MSEELKRALKATEPIEPPAVGFVKTYDYQNKLAGAVASTQKQNNTILQLFVQLFEKIAELQQELKEVKKNLQQQQSPASTSDDLLNQVITKLGKLSIADKVPEKRGKILVWKDPCLIYQEELAKLS